MRRPTTPITEQVYVNPRWLPPARPGPFSSPCWRSLVAASASSLGAQRPSSGEARLPGIDAVVEAAIAAGQTPGAVVLVGRGDRMLSPQAYGIRATEPTPRAYDRGYGVRPGVAYEGRRHDHRGDVAGGAGTAPARTTRSPAHVPGFERYGKGGITRSPPDDPRLGPAAGRRLRRAVDRLRRGHRTGARRGADRRARRALRLQRHQLLPARRDRPRA